MLDLLNCLQSRSEPNALVEVGHKTVAGRHLANLALRTAERDILNDKGEAEPKAR